MGSRIIDRLLEPDDFFIRNRIKEITTVFPATTTAASTSLESGLFPSEHGWLGWDTYMPPIDKIVTIFTMREKGHKEVCQELVDMFDQIEYKKVEDQINEAGKASAVTIGPYGMVKCHTTEERMQAIKDNCVKEGKRYMYVYDPQPDHDMHNYGPDSDVVKNIILERQAAVEKLAGELDDAVIFVIADHGHIVVEDMFVADYPEFQSLLTHTTSIEPRATSFRVKEGMHQQFEETFQRIFGQYFSLYSKQEVIDSQLFGPGEPHPFFYDELGDYISIAENSNRTIMGPENYAMYSQHAGYTDDEVYVPLIYINATGR